MVTWQLCLRIILPNYYGITHLLLRKFTFTEYIYHTFLRNFYTTKNWSHTVRSYSYKFVVENFRTFRNYMVITKILLFILADVIDTGQLVAIKGHKTVIDTNSVALQPQSSYWHRKF